MHKVVFIGESNVGKTSLIRAICGEEVSINEKATIGCNAHVTLQEKYDDTELSLNIWDTAGQLQYRSISPLFLRDSSVVVIVYSVINLQSFEVVGDLVKQVRDINGNATKIILVGNKKDLEDCIEVSFTEGFNCAESIDSLFVETSAYLNENIPILKDLILKSASSYIPQSDQGVKISLSNEKIEKNECNC